MSKLSFVALSLQTTHLDPASVSKVSYVKLVDGNITRQDDVPIISPTSKKKVVDEQSETPQLPWNEALEKLGMMIGKLPIVSYYRDADKEIFQAASRHVNIDPLRLHWLDARELARHLLPDLPDVQLSTVLKTLDLFDDHADSSAVEQTTQIVIALAQRQEADTVAQLWGELYDHPEDFLGLDSTFHGAAESGSSTDDDGVIDAPLAAEVLPWAAAAGTLTPAHDDKNTAATPADETDLPTASTDDQPDDVSASIQVEETVQESHRASETSEAPDDAVADANDDAVDEPLVDPLTAAAEELPAFLQEPTQDEKASWEPEPTGIDETPRSVPEVTTPAAVTDDSDSADDTADVLAGEANDDHATAEPAKIDEAAFLDAVRRPRANDDLLPPLISENSNESLVQAEEESSADSVGDDNPDLGQVDQQPALLQNPTHEPAEQPHEEPAEGEQEEPTAATPDETPSDSPRDLLEQVEQRNAPTTPSPAGPLVAPPLSVRSDDSDVSTPSGHTVQAIQVSERSRVEEPTERASKVNQIFGFVGLFVFGILTIIGVVLVVMAVMLFFTENSLMLETKIAGVILTLAIALLSLLMTNVSYRSFRKK